MSSDPEFESQPSSQNQFDLQDPVSQRKQYKKQSSSNSSNSNSQPQKQQSQDSSFNEGDLTQFKKLQIQILSALSAKEKHSAYQKEIMHDIIEKLQAFKEAEKGKLGEDLVSLRIQELVLTKILVVTYGKSDFRLASCHYHLGMAYFDHQCYQQAIEHVSTALHKAEKLIHDLNSSQTPKISAYYNIMQNSLGKCQIHKGNYEDAIETLRKAIQHSSKHKSYITDSNINSQAMILLSQCHFKLKQYQQAAQTINSVIKAVENKEQTHQELAFALNQKAKIEAAVNNYEQAIISQEQAINLLIQANYSKPEEVAEMYVNLAKYFQGVNNTDNAIKCMQKVKTLQQQIYGEQDKKVIKAKRKIATLYLKSQQLKEGLHELSQVLQLEQRIFGQSSVQCARTLKLLGTICMSLDPIEAKNYLKRSMNIFNSHGNRKQVIQLKNKIKFLTQGGSGNGFLDLKVITEQDAA